MSLYQTQERISIAVICGNVILIIFYLAALFHMRRGTKFPLFITVLQLLISACVFSSVLELSNAFIVVDEQTKKEVNIFLWVAITGICFIGWGITFNTAHWLFAYEYYTIAVTVPIIVLGYKPFTKQEVQRREMMKKVILGLNIGAPTMAGLFLYLDDFYYFKYGGQTPIQKTMGVLYSVFNMCNFTVQIVSGVFILATVHTFKKIMKKGLKPQQINSTNMNLHAATFAFFMIGLVLDCIFFVNYMLISGSAEAFREFIIVQTIAMVFSFLSQLLLCKIMYDLGKPMAMRPKSDNRNSLRRKSSRLDGTQDTSLNLDEEELIMRKGELQARLWNQFMRTNTLTSSIDKYFIDSEEIAYMGMGLVMDQARTPSLLERAETLASPSRTDTLNEPGRNNTLAT